MGENEHRGMMLRESWPSQRFPRALRAALKNCR
jgi:hypothetical protein